MAVPLEEQLRSLALVASAEHEDDVSDALLLIVRGMQLPHGTRRAFVTSVGHLLTAAEICQDIASRLESVCLSAHATTGA